LIAKGRIAHSPFLARENNPIAFPGLHVGVGEIIKAAFLTAGGVIDVSEDHFNLMSTGGIQRYQFAPLFGVLMGRMVILVLTPPSLANCS